MFDQIGGLKPRAPVVISGVKVGQVDAIPRRRLPRARDLDLDPALKLPVDTTASIVTAGLLGDRYVALQLGGEEQTLEDRRGDRRSPNRRCILERLIGKIGAQRRRRRAAEDDEQDGPDAGTATVDDRMLAVVALRSLPARHAARRAAPAARHPRRRQRGRRRRQPDYDPWQGMNREIFGFNDALDDYVLEPVARAGTASARAGRARRSATSSTTCASRSSSSTTSSRASRSRRRDLGALRRQHDCRRRRLLRPRHANGLGGTTRTSARRSALGRRRRARTSCCRSSGRQTCATRRLPVDIGRSASTPLFLDSYILVGARVIDIVNTRSQILDAVEEAKEASLDYYAFVRNAYLQRRGG